MTLKYVSGCVKLLLKLTVFLMFVFSTSSTKQCTPKTTERVDYVIRNVGIKLWQLKCAENGQCLSIEYNIDTLTCRLSRAESKKIKKREGYAILARDHSRVPTGSCTSSMCRFSQRCLKTRSGKNVCVQDQKQNDPEKSPQHKVDMQETFANSQLHEACRKGDLDRVRHILSQGLVDINSRDKKHGRTALMVAAQTGHCRVSDFHISKGATISDLDKACKNVLHWACKGGHVGMVKRVLPQYRYGKRGRCPTLLQAAMRGHRDVFEFLVCTGRSVSEVDGVGSNVLHYTCRGGQLAMVKYLVSQGSVDINSSNRDRITALMMAALRGKTDVIKFLISMGANVSHVDIMGNNVLTLAIIKTHLAVVKYLVSQSSVDINGVRRSGRTPLMTAVSSGDKDVFDFLVKKGANVSHVDIMGNNVLTLAIIKTHLAVVKYLVSQSSVDINGVRRSGRTPLMTAVSSGDKDVFDFLVKKGANVSHVDDNGHNILHLASSYGRMKIVKYILSKDLVDINARDKVGNTAAMIAKRNRKRSVYNLLVSRGCPVK